MSTSSMSKFTDDDHHHLHPRCVASCTATRDDSGSPSRQPQGRERDAGRRPNFFREAEFSGDGTTIVTQGEYHCLSTFVLPSNLLDKTQQPHVLRAYSTYASPSALHSYAIYPHFDLQDPSATLVLCASADVPISLRNALHYDTVHAKYQSIDASTEAYLHSNALTFTRDGSRFIAGSHSRLEMFDCSRSGSGPVLTHRTASGKKARKLLQAPNAGCKGLVGALSISDDGVLAAGTMLREIALYAQEGSGECITCFSLAASSSHLDPAKGTGVSYLKWSPCGTYLLIAERQSEGVHIYDVRNTLRRVSWLSGRRADTTQKLGIDIVPTAEGYEVWGGSTDGYVRMWRNAGKQEDEHVPDAEFKLHDNAVSSAVWHPAGAVLATCSGQRLAYPESEVGGTPDSEEHESSLEGAVDVRRYSDATKPDGAMTLWTI